MTCDILELIFKRKTNFDFIIWILDYLRQRFSINVKKCCSGKRFLSFKGVRNNMSSYSFGNMHFYIPHVREYLIVEIGKCVCPIFNKKNFVRRSAKSFFLSQWLLQRWGFLDSVRCMDSQRSLLKLIICYLEQEDVSHYTQNWFWEVRLWTQLHTKFFKSFEMFKSSLTKIWFLEIFHSISRTG